MTLVTKGILASVSVLGIAEAGDVPEWATKALLILAFGAVQWLASRQIASLDKRLEAVDSHVAAIPLIQRDVNTMNAIGALRSEIGLSDRLTRAEAAVATTTGEVSKLREHWHDLAKVVSSCDARIATLIARSEGHSP